jgi:hypothetical protein
MKNPDRVKKTAIGGCLAALGFTTIMVSPYAGVTWSGLEFPWTVVAYTGIFLFGFVSLLYGAGLVLIENNLWG